MRALLLVLPLLATACFDNSGGKGDGHESGGCHVGGCSAQLCSDDPELGSTCEWTDAYACYADATCERQTGGECGWTQTAELSACLESPPSH